MMKVLVVVPRVVACDGVDGGSGGDAVLLLMSPVVMDVVGVVVVVAVVVAVMADVVGWLMGWLGWWVHWVGWVVGAPHITSRTCVYPS